jgi:hypothetical protein
MTGHGRLHVKGGGHPSRRRVGCPLPPMLVAAMLKFGTVRHSLAPLGTTRPVPLRTQSVRAQIDFVMRRSDPRLTAVLDGNAAGRSRTAAAVPRRTSAGQARWRTLGTLVPRAGSVVVIITPRALRRRDDGVMATAIVHYAGWSTGRPAAARICCARLSGVLVFVARTSRKTPWFSSRNMQWKSEFGAS